MPAQLLNLVLSATFGRYLLTSVLSLGCDVGLFLLLLSGGMAPMGASAAGYGAGIVVHWLLSTRFVFDQGMASQGAVRVRQKGLFVGTALLGLAITTAIVGWGAQLGLDPRIAKLIAVAVSFQATYMARRVIIFRP
jgi:putative flippase GtrA